MAGAVTVLSWDWWFGGYWTWLNENSPAIQAVTGVVAAVVTPLFVYFTLQALRASREAVTEARNEYMNSALPALIFEFAKVADHESFVSNHLYDYRRHRPSTTPLDLLNHAPYLCLKVTNAGTGPALWPKFTFDSVPEDPNGGPVHLTFQSESPSTLNAGQFTLCQILLGGGGDPERLKTVMASNRFQIESRYQDLFGRQRLSSVTLRGLPELTHLPFIIDTDVTRLTLPTQPSELQRTRRRFRLWPARP